MEIGVQTHACMHAWEHHNARWRQQIVAGRGGTGRRLAGLPLALTDLIIPSLSLSISGCGGTNLYVAVLVTTTYNIVTWITIYCISPSSCV
jgi:hypothetical protein